MTFFPSFRRRRPVLSPEGRRNHLIAEFLRQPAHEWIVRDRALLTAIGLFFAQLPVDHLETLFRKRKLLMLACQPSMSCSFYQYEGREIILLFPDLLALLKSAGRTEGFAVLAHELGHVYYEHSKRKIPERQAQLEADHFAWEAGWREELIAVLAEYPPSEELVARLERLVRADYSSSPNFSTAAPVGRNRK
jgi:hypothetical protein